MTREHLQNEYTRLCSMLGDITVQLSQLEAARIHFLQQIARVQEQANQLDQEAQS